MKYLKVSIIVFALLSILLMSSCPVYAKVERIEFYGSGDPGTFEPTIEKTILAGPNTYLFGHCISHVTTYDMNGNLLPEQTGWAAGMDVHVMWVDGQYIEHMKIIKVPDVYEGGYWEGTYTTIPNSGGQSKVVLEGKGTFQGMHTEVTNLSDGTFVGFMTIKED